MTSPQTTEVGLVLQGGGALGAYEYGGITGLFDLIDEAEAKGRKITLKVVTGVSIGAINAACVVGAHDRADARRRLAALWDDFIINTPPFLPPQVGRNLSLYGVPDFYAPRFDVLTIPSWTYVYDTHPLLHTLSSHIDFAALNANETAFVITAVDVESGELTRFANRAIGETKPTTIEPHHVVASGSLPPSFPWTDIADGAKVHHYWDGGIVDNTPLGDAIDAFSSGAGVQRILVVMNLFPATAKLPGSFTEVNDRMDQLRFGNRLHQDKENAEMINDLISTIEQLATLVPGELPADLKKKVGTASAYKLVEPIEISLVTDVASSDEYGFRDFSRQGVEARRKAGHAITIEKLRPVFASAPVVSS
ncbi:MAG TPA: patatin-like phospholipase family protein [Xanthobacteraceae bacterium]|jgi:predicted acylesterase/phospholipase RssA|nr:patatin-like phospholipase family protein [Xanthobacteraceae bacterium]